VQDVDVYLFSHSIVEKLLKVFLADSNIFLTEDVELYDKVTETSERVKI
jgi:hypothetical protein